MSITPNTTWQHEFGIDATSSSNFFINRADIDSRDVPVSYAHIVRRAFDLLELDGVWCDQNNPLVYFKLVKQIIPEEISRLHRLFWNHGGAAILVVVSPHEVQVYSGLAQPSLQANATDQPSGFVITIRRASRALQEFLPAVASGEFFRRHARSFDPKQRVDQSLLVNLQATREKLAGFTTEHTTIEVLDAFLCRLVFTCYLFDREVIGASYLNGIGLPALPHLRDVLSLKPRSTAKDYLYRLFHRLAQDFNGDLFSDELDAEADLLSDEHFEVVEAFFRATDVTTGQQAIWPYDFGVIPIETVSAIYERFLKPSDRSQGAFYTPRFLAELVLDIVLSDRPSLIGLRFLDPACGSGIFLVGLFHRLAEEWRRENPEARNDQRARELMQIMQESIFGIDFDPTACRITAFSLYLTYLDQLTPRDIQELQAKGNALPRLVIRSDEADGSNPQARIWCGDFFREDATYPTDVDIVIGNPPWGSIEENESAANSWCEQLHLEVPNKQIAAAFMWKATQHVSNSGRVCLIIPYGILFNENPTAIAFQKAFLSKHTLDRVLNLTDFQRFLFSEAEYPALVLSYRAQAPDKDHIVSYWFPKVDWKAKNADVISISEADQSEVSIRSVLQGLEGEDGLRIWKQLGRATPRDHRLLERLTDATRLRDFVRHPNEEAPEKPWLIAAGFQPFGLNDDPNSSQVLELPTDLFIETSSSKLHLFVLEEDCTQLDSAKVRVRARSNKTVEVFYAPHVLVTEGFSSVAFADFAVSFRHTLRGIVGTPTDRKLLMFLAAYLRSSLAQYFLFHTSSKWGVTRQQVTVNELLRLPFLWPDTMPDAYRANQIVEEVAQHIDRASRKARDPWVDRTSLVNTTQAQIEPLILEYFDVLPSEYILIKDTVDISIPSFRPTAQRKSIPSIEPSSKDEIDKYTSRLCETLNNWAKRSNSYVLGVSKRSLNLGVGLVILEKNAAGGLSALNNDRDVLEALNELQRGAATKVNTFELLRGVKVFDANHLYIMKPLGRRHWTETAALNDADEIASSILMQSSERIA